MDNTNTNVQVENEGERRNWWKIGFWLALLAFEITREFAVVVSQSPPFLGGAFFIETVRPGRVIASGKWERIDGGEPILPVLTSIDCKQELGSCVIAETVLWDKDRIFPPNIETFSANFSDNAVTFVNDAAICVKYSVRLDLDLKKAISLREPLKGATGSICEAAKDRMEMRLVEPVRPSDWDDFGGHFLPIVKGLKFFTGLR